MGFRPHAGLGGVLSAVAIVVVFAMSLAWVWAGISLVVRSSTTVTILSFVIQFPLTFASNVFVDPKTMPGWLHTFVDLNPVSHLVTAVRDLMSGTAGGSEIVGVLLAAAVITTVFGPLTMRLYRSG